MDTDIPTGPLPGEPGWENFYDGAIFEQSGGKDSQQTLWHGMKVIGPAMFDRTAVLHIDLGPDVEWDQVPQLALEQASRSGFEMTDGKAWGGRFHYTSRPGPDLISDIETRTKKDNVTPTGWPTMFTRYCTSDFKTAPGRKFAEMVSEHIREERGLNRPVRLLQVMGFRAQESPRRGRVPALEFQPRISAKTKRHVFRWLPVQQIEWPELWAGIRESGVPYHPVYDEGMKRLSCRHCIMASRRDLAISKRLSPVTAARIERVEVAVDDPFQRQFIKGAGKKPLWFRDIEPEPGRKGLVLRWTNCPEAGCGVRVLARDVDTVRYCPAHAETGPWDFDGADDSGGCGTDDDLMGVLRRILDEVPA